MAINNIEPSDYKNLTPFKAWLVNQINTWGINNFPFLESDFDKLTNYGMMMKLMKAINNVIANENLVEQDMQRLFNAFTELQNYINNYFDNLDVQDAINNKLDQMALDGSLTQLIGQYVDPIINDFKSDVNQELETFEENVNASITAQNTRISAVESGAPLAASSTSGMTDTSRVYVNTTDGYWYYYNGSAWTQGGVYQASVTALESYTRGMFKEFLDVLETLCDLENIIPSLTWEDGYFYSKTGVKTAYTNSKCTTLNVKPGEMYYINGYNAASANCYNILDGNNNVIETPTDSGYNYYFVIIPSNGTTLQLSAITSRVFEIKKVSSLKLTNSQVQDIFNMYSINYTEKDLLENATYTNNYIYDSPTGELIEYNGFMASNKIAIPEGATKLTLASSKPTTLAILFDENENFVRNIHGISTQSEDEPKEITLASNEKYIGVNIYKANTTVQKVTCDALYEIVEEEESKVIDLFMFMGQSNMCGQGNPAQAPTLITGAGYEYSDSLDTIYPITEPAGENDNQSTNGSMITAFANAYYTNTNIPIVESMVAVSGSGIDEWQPNTTYLNRAIQTLGDAITYLTRMGYTIRHKNMLWLQGEHEGARGESSTYYKTMFNNMFNAMKTAGIEHCFIVRIGEYNGSSSTVDFSTIIQAQTEMCQDNKDIIMATTTLASMKDRNLMNDQYHMSQTALNEAGEYSGVNCSIYLNTNKEPTMYDYKYNDLYYSHIN